MSTLTQDQIDNYSKAIKEVTKEITRSKQKTLSFLISAGIIEPVKKPSKVAASKRAQ